jgi:cyclic pyranopterin phosphate synthase
MRAHPGDDAPLVAAIRTAIAHKPERHEFHIGAGEAPAVARHMSMTGG